MSIWDPHNRILPVENSIKTTPTPPRSTHNNPRINHEFSKQKLKRMQKKKEEEVIVGLKWVVLISFFPGTCNSMGFLLQVLLSSLMIYFRTIWDFDLCVRTHIKYVYIKDRILDRIPCSLEWSFHDPLLGNFFSLFSLFLFPLIPLLLGILLDFSISVFPNPSTLIGMNRN